MTKYSWLVAAAALGLVLGGCDSKKAVLPSNELKATKDAEKVGTEGEGAKTLPPPPKDQ